MRQKVRFALALILGASVCIGIGYLGFLGLEVSKEEFIEMGSFTGREIITSCESDLTVEIYSKGPFVAIIDHKEGLPFSIIEDPLEDNRLRYKAEVVLEGGQHTLQIKKGTATLKIIGEKEREIKLKPSWIFHFYLVAICIVIMLLSLVFGGAFNKQK